MGGREHDVMSLSYRMVIRVPSAVHVLHPQLSALPSLWAAPTEPDRHRLGVAVSAVVGAAVLDVEAASCPFPYASRRFRTLVYRCSASRQLFPTHTISSLRSDGRTLTGVNLTRDSHSGIPFRSIGPPSVSLYSSCRKVFELIFWSCTKARVYAGEMRIILVYETPKSPLLRLKGPGKRVKSRQFGHNPTRIKADCTGKWH